MFGSFPEDENSSRQRGRVTYDFHSPGSFDTRIGEWASAKEKPCISLHEFCPWFLLNLMILCTF